MKYSNKLQKITIIPKVLSLKTNVTDFIPYFSLGAFVRKVDLENKGKINLTFKVANHVEKPKELNKKIENFWGADNVLKIFYEKQLTRSIRFNMLIELIKDEFIFTVNKLYFKYCPFRLDRMFPSGGHLQNAAILKLADFGFTVLHGACISKKGQGILLIASSNTGKSLTTFSAVENGWKFLSEDMVALDRDFAYGAPLISVRACYQRFSGDNQLNKSKAKKFHFLENLKFFLNLPRIFSIQKVPSYEPFDEFVRSGKIISKTKIAKMVILERDEGGISKISKREFLGKLFILNRGEYSYYHDTFLRAFSYFNPHVDTNIIVKQEEKILTHLVDKTEPFLFRSRDPQKFAEYLDKI